MKTTPSLCRLPALLVRAPGTVPLPLKSAYTTAAGASGRNCHFIKMQSPSEQPSTRRTIHQNAMDRSGMAAGVSDPPGRHSRSPSLEPHDQATPKEPSIHPIFESVTGTWQYVVADQSTLTAAIIDPVLDFDPATGTIATGTADSLLSLVEAKGYSVHWILETHAHADHMTAASYLQKRLGQMQQGHRPATGIGKRIGQVQELFGRRYGIPGDELYGVFDRLFEDDEIFSIGTLAAQAIHLPGHTPDHLGYRIGENIFCGDSIFHADIGTARCDFPGGSAASLFQSGQKLLKMPGHLKIWTGHDYPPLERAKPVAYMTVEQHRKDNKHLRDGIEEEEFVGLRTERDASLAAPRLLHPSLQTNVRAGRLPKPTGWGDRMLRQPLRLPGGVEF